MSDEEKTVLAFLREWLAWVRETIAKLENKNGQ